MLFPLCVKFPPTVNVSADFVEAADTDQFPWVNARFFAVTPHPVSARAKMPMSAVNIKNLGKPVNFMTPPSTSAKLEVMYRWTYFNPRQYCWEDYERTQRPFVSIVGHCFS
jgi:hypothetical protein